MRRGGCRNVCLAILLGLAPRALGTPQTVPVPPVSYAVVIGISEFEDPQMQPVPGASANADAVASALLGSRVGLSARNVVKLTDRDANTFSVQRALENVLTRRATASDSVVVFIAGTARTEAVDGFLMTYDSNPGAKRTTAFSLAQLDRALRQSKAGGVYLFIDLAGDPMQTALERMGATQSVVFAAVSSGSDLSFSKTVASTMSGGEPGSLTAQALLSALQSSSSQRLVIRNVTKGATQAETPKPLLFANQPGALLFAPKVAASAAKPQANAPVPSPNESPVAPPPAEQPPPPVQQQPAPRDPRATAAAILIQARTQFNAGQWGDAIASCNRALQVDARSQPALQLLKQSYLAQGNAQQQSGDFAAAKSSFDSAAAADPADPAPKALAQSAELEGLIHSGQANLQQSRWEAAGTDFKAALAIKPDPRAETGVAVVDVHVAYEAGMTAFRQKDFAAASDRFSQVLKLQPQIKEKPALAVLAPLFTDAQVKSKQCGTELLLGAGIDSFNRGEYPAARAIFGEILKNDSNNQRAMEQLMLLARVDDINRAVASGREKLKARDWNGALRDFENALDRNPNDVRAREGRQQAQDAIWARQRNAVLTIAGIGIPACAFFVVMAPSDRRARMYARMGWNEKAAGLLERILAKNPTRTDAVIYLFRLYSGLGKRDAAIQLALGYLQLKPDDVGVLMLLGETYLERHEYGLGRERFQHILGLDPGHEIACLRLVAIDDEAPDTSGAGLEACEEALAAHPADPCLNRLVSRYYERNGRRDANALEILRRAVEAEPSNLRLQAACAEACVAQGRPRDAIRHAREVLQHDPSNRLVFSLFLQAAGKCGSLESAFELVDGGRLDGLAMITACEEIAALDPGQRVAVHQRYEQLARQDGAGPAPVLARAHLAIDDGAGGASWESVTAVAALDAADPMCQRGTAGVLARFLEANRGAEGYPERCASLIFRLGELHRQLGESRAALAAFQSIARVPEWLVRCDKAMNEILEGHDGCELTAVFFQDVGWKANANAKVAPGARDLLLQPPEAGGSTLFALFENAKARCFDRTITLEDVVRLKRDLAEQDVVNGEYAFVVSPLRARQDVLALIYALLTEEPSLRVIPLEGTALKQGILEGRSAEVLEQLLRLWVGQADLFDVHSPIADASTFFGRGQFIHTLTTKIIQGENFGIFGLRKVGKTSLVFQLRENLPKNLIGYVDLQSVSSRRCDEIYFRLSAALRRELRIKFPEAPQIVSPFTEFDAREQYPTIASDFHRELMRIKEAIESRGEQPRILLLLDEIELLMKNDQNRGFSGYENFFRQIRGLYQQERFVLSGVVGADPSACRAGKWGDRDNPIFQYYDEIFLTPLDRSECDQMVEAIGEVMGVSFDAPALARIYHETGGHPYVSRQLCSRVVGRYTQRPLDVTEPMVAEGVDDYIAQRPDYFIGVFRGYISTEARQILQVAAAADDPQVSRAELLTFAAKAGIDRALMDRALQDLELFHLMVRDKDQYHIKIQLLRRWIRQSWLGAE